MIQLENLDFMCYLMGKTLRDLFGSYGDLPDKNTDLEWSLPAQGSGWLEERRWKRSPESMRFSQLNVKESESKGNASDSGQESKDTAELTGPGSTQYIGELGCERGVMT